MRRVAVSAAALDAEIEAESSGWQTRSSRTWSEIKGVYLRLQGWKCIFCESPLPEADLNSTALVAVAIDVEHYRPKDKCSPWPGRRPASFKDKSVTPLARKLASGPPDGYPQLALERLNYAVACKPCNSSCKGTYFPILGSPAMTDGTDIQRMNETERPALLFPFGPHGDDPDLFLQFIGPVLTARPDLARDSATRAQVTIDLFELDTRESLLRERMALIERLWPALESGDMEYVHGLGAPEGHSGHIACQRAFVALYASDRDGARRLYEASLAYTRTLSPR